MGRHSIPDHALPALAAAAKEKILAGEINTLDQLLTMFNKIEFLKITGVSERDYLAIRVGLLSNLTRSRIRTGFDLTTEQLERLLK